VICSVCKEDKPTGEFYTRKSPSGVRVPKNPCKACERDRRSWSNLSPETRAKKILNHTAWRKRARRKPEYRGRSIYIEARKFDRGKGFDNDLTRHIVEGLIAQGCAYCGDTELIQMSLDRIDNDRGHTEDNVVPACLRCNYTRKNMPYEAWLILAPAMRDARIRGLFGDWTGRVR